MIDIKYMYEEVKKVFDDKGYILLESPDEIKNKNVTDKLRYICPKHEDKGELQITFSKICNNRGCVYCGRETSKNKRQKPIEDYLEKYKQATESNGFIFVNLSRVDVPNSNKTQLIVDFICPRHVERGTQSIVARNMLRKMSGCNFCRGAGLSPDEIVEQIINKLPQVEVLDLPQNKVKNIRYRCKIHGYESSTSPQNLLAGRGCYYYGLEKLSENGRLTQEEFIQRMKIINSDIEIIGKYIDRKHSVAIKCNKCGKTSDVPVWTLYRRQNGCPNCSPYLGENAIQMLLEKWNYNYIRQYYFDDCRDKKPLLFDFYLPDYNICIEYDGIQHYIPKIIHNGMTQEAANYTHEQTKIHDKIKNEYCKKHTIPLIRIPYWELEDDNISYYLFDNLQKYGAILKIA